MPPTVPGRMAVSLSERGGGGLWNGPGLCDGWTRYFLVLLPPKKKTKSLPVSSERKSFSLSWLEGDALTGYLWDCLTSGTLWPLGPCSLRQSLTGNNATDCCCCLRCLQPLLNWNETKWHEMSCLIAASVLFFLLGLLLLLMISAVSMESSLLCFFGLVCFFEPVFRPVVVVFWSD